MSYPSRTWTKRNEEKKNGAQKSGSGSPRRSSSSARSSIARRLITDHRSPISGSMVCHWAWAFDGRLFGRWCGCDNDSCCSSCLEHVVPRSPPAPVPSPPGHAPLLCCNCRRHTFRALFDLEIATDRLGMGNISRWGHLIDLAFPARALLGMTRLSSFPCTPLHPRLFHSFGPLSTMKIFDSSPPKCVCVN